MVVERERPGAGASGAAAGMLSPLPESPGPGAFLELALASLELYPEFVARLSEATGIDVGYRREGKLEVALDEAGTVALKAALAWRLANGHCVEWLDSAEARRLEPALGPDVRAALLNTHEQQVDNRILTRASWLAAAKAGVRFRVGELAVGLTTAQGRVTGISLASGEVLPAGQVVIAAGCWSAQFAGLPRPLPIAPIRGQIVVLESTPPLLTRVVGASGCYLVPRRDGRLVIGSTMEQAGFNTRATGGGVARLLAAALAVVPACADAEVAELRAGLRPGTPDGLPILGPDPELAGLYYATGHLRNGILLAPITARLLSEAIMTEGSSISLVPFAPERFAVRDGIEVPG
jgi:glycine oxidase